MADTFRIDTADFDIFADSLKAASKELRRELSVDLKQAGEIVATEARALSGAHSKRIPGTIRTRARASGQKVSVVISAGGPGVPEAYLLERGNKDRPASTTFRHPVFGGDVYVEQDKHPYLAPALETRRDEVVERIHSAVERTVRRLEPKDHA